MITQLPKTVQQKAKEDFATKKGTGIISDADARVFLANVKKLMSDRGLPLDIGCQRLDEIEEQTAASSRVAAVNEEEFEESHDVQGPVNRVYNNFQGSRGRGRNRRRNNNYNNNNNNNYSSNNNNNHNSNRDGNNNYNSNRDGNSNNNFRNSGNPRKQCFVCNKTGHVASVCTSQYCQRCGDWGHGISMCNNPNRKPPGVNAVHDNVSEENGVPEESAMIEMELEGRESEALLDSGAGPSVMDLLTLKKANLKWKMVPWEEDLKSFDDSSKKTVGYVNLQVRVGDVEVTQRFKVIKSRRPIKTILGRDFLYKFGSTEFDWVKGQIRLGEQWITPLLWMRGGTHNDRVAMAMSSSGEDMKFDINPNLDDSQKSRLRSLLEEYSDCFAENPKKPTATPTGTHIIETVQGARPHKAKRYRMSPQQEEETNKQAEEMLSNGIIRPSNSPWAHNVILVRKRDGSTRFVIDYRPINEVTIKDSYPMPNIREIVDKMKGSKYFCKMDMASAYWSVPIKEEDREKTAFMTPRGLYEMCVTGYGLCNCQATYQRMMDKALEGVNNAASFVDDVSTYNESFEEMLVTLRQTLERLRAANLQMRIDKCMFGYEEIDYVGYHISSDGLSPIYDNVKDILAFPAPTNLKELERFLGMAGYYREFLPRMAELAEPLNRLRKKGQPFSWTSECESSFQELKKCLASPPVLAFPDWKSPFYIEADACDHSVGGVLSQRDEATGKLRPIGYYSLALDKSKKHYDSQSERDYDAREKECWALVAGTRKWSTYCRAATKVMLITDHNPLKWLRQQPDPRGKFGRWLMELENITYQIVYRNGLNHTVPDCMSRSTNAAPDPSISNEAEHFEQRIFAVRTSEPWLERVAAAQADDDAIKNAIQQLRDHQKVSMGRFKRMKNLHIEKDILMQGKRIVVPLSLRYEIVDDCHKSIGHAGAARTIGVVARNYLWTGMHTYVEDFCSHCVTCLKNKGGKAGKEPLQPYTLDDLTPRNVIAFDVATLPWATHQHRYFLVIVDLFSKYCEAVPMKDQLAGTIEKCLLDAWIHRHGKPKIAVSDQAKNVDGRVVNALCSKLGIEKRHSSPYHPEGNGQAERSVQSLKTLVRCVMAEEELPKYAWPSILQKATFMHNASTNTSTKHSPHELMYGTQPTFLSPKCSPELQHAEAVSVEDHVEETRTSMGEKWNSAAENLAQSKEQYKKQYDSRGTVKQKEIKVGEFVYLKNQTRTSSLDPLYKGPYEVVAVGSLTVTVQSHQRGRITVHKNNVRASQKADIIVLPSAEPAEEPKDEGSPQKDPSEKGEASSQGAAKDPTEEGEVIGDLREAGENFLVGGDVDELELPIAIRKPFRHKPRLLGEDYVSK